MDEQFEFLKAITESLNTCKIPYMLTGSLAMAIYAEPRMTRDIDLVVEYKPEDSAAIVRLFEDTCIVDADMVEQAAGTRVYSTSYTGSGSSRLISLLASKVNSARWNSHDDER